jgi:hypothetical protein
MSGSRYPATLPKNLSPKQRVFYDEMTENINNGLGSTLVSFPGWRQVTTAE